MKLKKIEGQFKLLTFHSIFSNFNMRKFYFLGCIVCFISCADDTTQQVENLPIEVSKYAFDQETIVEVGSETIWGIDAIDDFLIFTTKSGDIYTYQNNTLVQLTNPIKNSINAAGQGGLMDIKLHPNFGQNQWVFISYTEKVEGSNFSYVKIDRLKIEEANITEVQTIFKTNSMSSRAGHFGSRLLFHNNYLFFCIGEGSPSQGGPNSPYQNAQDLTNDWGKIHRIYWDGSIPEDNPFYGKTNVSQSIYSFGHRNPQGLTYDATNDRIVSTEHGPKGGDEINIILSGENYGWPLVSLGVNYDGSDISGKSHEKYKEPIFSWDPSIATSQLIALNDKSYGDWLSSYLICGLKSESIHRVAFVDNEYVEMDVIDLGARVRSICDQGNGIFYVTTDAGKITKFSPK